MAVDIIKDSHRTDIEVARYTSHEVYLYLCLEAVVITFIIVIRTVFISFSPIQAGERIEIKIVIQTVFVLWKEMISTYPQQIETYRRYIAV